jgi:hypothetical protein
MGVKQKGGRMIWASKKVQGRVKKFDELEKEGTETKTVRELPLEASCLSCNGPIVGIPTQKTFVCERRSELMAEECVST